MEEFRNYLMKKKYLFIEKCLEILAVSCYSTSILLLVFNFLILAYIALFSKNWIVLPILLLWVWYDRETPYKGGRPSRIVTANPILKYFRSYFPMKLVKTVDLDPDKNYLFCSHPHGFCCVAVYGNFIIEYSEFKQLFPGFTIRTAMTDLNFKYPLIREYILALGLISASKKSLKYLLNDDKKGNIVNVLIGGSDEVFYSAPGHYKIILERKKGFVKIALTVGCSLVPVFNFGEIDAFRLLSPKPGGLMDTLQRLLNKVTGLHWTVPYGSFWLFPKRTPVTSVVGKPIQLPKIAEPTQEQIDHYHALYVKELIQLFNKHKFHYIKDPEKTHLIIVE